LSRVIELCCSIERRALVLYQELAESARHEELGTLWREMARDEGEHLAYWRRLLEMSRSGCLSEVFDRPEEAEDFLLHLIPKIDRLAGEVRKSQDPSTVLVLALRLEFYLLDPRFQSLFHCLYALPGRQDPEKDYETHLQRLMSVLRRYADDSPALELLTEAIDKIWKLNLETIRFDLIDHLTGLYNRRGLSSTMRPLAYLARRNAQSVGIMMVDLDDFKLINDTFGHPAGDRVLAGVTQLMRSRLRASDIIGRYGGEEFLAVMTPTDPQSLASVAETLRGAIESNPIDGIRTTVSIGISHGLLKTNVEKDLEGLIHQADQALLAAKRSGKNRVVAWKPKSGLPQPTVSETDFSQFP